MGKAASWPRMTEWQILDPIESRSANGADLIEAGRLVAHFNGPVPGQRCVHDHRPRRMWRQSRALRLEVMADPSLPQGGPGRQGNGNLHLTEFVVTATPVDDPTAAQRGDAHKAAGRFQSDAGVVDRRCDRSGAGDRVGHLSRSRSVAHGRVRAGGTDSRRWADCADVRIAPRIWAGSI